MHFVCHIDRIHHTITSWCQLINTNFIITSIIWIYCKSFLWIGKCYKTFLINRSLCYDNLNRKSNNFKLTENISLTIIWSISIQTWTSTSCWIICLCWIIFTDKCTHIWSYLRIITLCVWTYINWLYSYYWITVLVSFHYSTQFLTKCLHSLVTCWNYMLVRFWAKGWLYWFNTHPINHKLSITLILIFIISI